MRADDDVPRMCEGVGGPCEGIGVCRLGLPAEGGMPRSGYHPRSISACSLAKPMLAAARPRSRDWTDGGRRIGRAERASALWFRPALHPSLSNLTLPPTLSNLNHYMYQPRVPGHQRGRSLYVRRDLIFASFSRLFRMLLIGVLAIPSSCFRLLLPARSPRAQGAEGRLRSRAAALQRLIG